MKGKQNQRNKYKIKERNKQTGNEGKEGTTKAEVKKKQRAEIRIGRRK
jgi:hypothetical protein